MWYDINKSVGENYKQAKEDGRKVSLSTLKRYCQYNDIDTNPNHKPISEWYLPHLSVAENLAYARSNNIKIGKTALYNYCKANGIPTKGRAIESAPVPLKVWPVHNVHIPSPSPRMMYVQVAGSQQSLLHLDSKRELRMYALPREKIREMTALYSHQQLLMTG